MWSRQRRYLESNALGAAVARLTCLLRARPLALLLALSWSLTAPTARGEQAPFSPYERGVLTTQLNRLGAELETEPEGKLISSIELVRLDVFDETDPIPDFVDVFHTTTRPHVIGRELLFATGQPFHQRYVDESARNLKALIQLSLVLIVPLTDVEPGHVRVLVITKDVWSLRLNQNFQYDRDGLTYLLLNPTETNLAGLHANIGGYFLLKRSTYSLGFLTSINRIAGSRLATTATASLVFNRATSKYEGTFGSFSYGLPRYSERQRWLYAVQLTWDYGLQRVRMQTEGKSTVLLPYLRELYTGSSNVTRSFGLRDKRDLSVGVEVDRRANRSRAPAATDPSVAARFEQTEIPLSDTRISPYVALTLYENEFLKTIELETLGLQEDFRLGPQLVFKVFPASKSLGSSRNLLGLLGGASYTLRLGDGLVRALGSVNVQLSNPETTHALASAALRLATPRLGFGRFIIDGVLENRFKNYLRVKSALGGDGRLRGYPAADTEAADNSDQRGGDVIAINTELRSRAIGILSAQCGIALFHDVGAVSNDFEALHWKESVGAGLRILFPQLDRIVFRADWGFPLLATNRTIKTWPGGVFLTFSQAFLMPEL
jgi:hypothetical protein